MLMPNLLRSNLRSTDTLKSLPLRRKLSLPSRRRKPPTRLTTPNILRPAKSSRAKPKSHLLLLTMLPPLLRTRENTKSRLPTLKMFSFNPMSKLLVRDKKPRKYSRTIPPWSPNMNNKLPSPMSKSWRLRPRSVHPKKSKELLPLE